MAEIPIFYSPSNGGFYDPFVHGVFLPLDCVPVTRGEHRQLFEDQERGMTIVAGGNGRPVARDWRDGLLAELREALTLQVDQEAAARIVAVADLAQQSNDNATFALLAASAQRSLVEQLEFDRAFARREAINAIRAAAQALKRLIAREHKRILKDLDPRADQYWPEDLVT